VKELREIGIQPDVVLCRADRPLPDGDRRKIALFTNVPEKAVISAVDLETIYRIPLWLHQQGLDDIVVQQLRLAAPPADLGEWDRTVHAVEHARGDVTIAICGKYVEHKDAYKSLGEALRHGGLKQGTRVNLRWIESEQLEQTDPEVLLDDVDGILVPGGFGRRGFEGKILAARHARERRIPYFGICYGMHAAVAEYARHVLGLEGANSTENDRQTPHPVIALITEWRTSTGEVERRDEASDKGGTMRLGAQECRLKAGTLARDLYGKDVISERHRHRYEFNNLYRQQFEDHGLVVAGKSMDDLLVEMIEIKDHPWFLACQFHPEFTSTPRDGHPLFHGFVRAARIHRAKRLGTEAAA
jgi:CTP synthase